jgi:methanogenic corrinoid protein MtbC1
MTGLNREILRKWEIRFQYPIPIRGARGERRYQERDVTRLQLVAQLLAVGRRPKEVVPLGASQLCALLNQCIETSADSKIVDGQLQHPLIIHLLATSDHEALRAHFELLIRRDGLAAFVETMLPAFNAEIGVAWASGRLSIHGEHFYTETIQAVVSSASSGFKPKVGAPCVLITTPPGEDHGLGVVAIKCLLDMQGANCISLGTQTPAVSVRDASSQWAVRAVLISISSFLQPQAARNYIQSLRLLLPADVRVWVGGMGAQCLKTRKPAGVEVLSSSSEAIAAWHALS